MSAEVHAAVTAVKVTLPSLPDNVTPAGVGPVMTAGCAFRRAKATYFRNLLSLNASLVRRFDSPRVFWSTFLATGGRPSTEKVPIRCGRSQWTERLGAQMLDPIKTTNVQHQRCMTTWCLLKPA